MKHLFVICLYFTFNFVLSQSGANDPTFDPGSGAGQNNGIGGIALQSDGKILIAGGFNSYQGIIRKQIARLDTDGSLDLSFDPGNNIESYVENAILLQPDGKIIVGQTGYTSGTTARVTRLNPDGSSDTTFIQGVATHTFGGSNGSVVRALALQSDGKVLVGGYFTYYFGEVRNHVARLNADGSLDTTFIPEIEGVTSAGVRPNSLAIQPDGKILIGGEFNDNTKYLLRLNPDGSLDTTFNMTGGFYNPHCLALQSDGKILISTGLNATRVIARLNTDGSQDISFNIVQGKTDNLLLQPDGKIIVAGSNYYSSYNGISAGSVARLNIDGSIDFTFYGNISSSITGFLGQVNGFALQPDGKILMAGKFTHYNGIPRRFITRILNCNTPATETFTHNTCSSYTWTSGDGQTYYSDTIVTHTIPNGAVNGCDSVVTLNLSIINIDTTVFRNNGGLTANQPGATYQWLDCTNNNQPILGATSQSYTPSNNGVYAVQITSETCMETSECFTFNNLGTETMYQSPLFIFPNPNNGTFNIEIPGINSPFDVKIVNATGQAVYASQIHSENTTIDLTGQAAGIYIIHLETNERVIQEKIIIK